MSDAPETATDDDGTRPTRRRGALVAVMVGAVLALGAAVGLVRGGGGGPPDLDVREVAADAAAPGDGEFLDGGLAEAAAFVRDNADAGRPTVVNLFASWCAPCREELPVLLAASEQNPDVGFLGISSEDLPRERGVAFVEEEGVTWPVVYDPDAEVRVALEGRVMPVTAAFDAEGRLVRVVQEQLDEPELDALLADVDAGPAGS